MVRPLLLRDRDWSRFDRICASRINYWLRRAMVKERHPGEETLSWLERMCITMADTSEFFNFIIREIESEWRLSLEMDLGRKVPHMWFQLPRHAGGLGIGRLRARWRGHLARACERVRLVRDFVASRLDLACVVIPPPTPRSAFDHFGRWTGVLLSEYPLLYVTPPSTPRGQYSWHFVPRSDLTPPWPSPYPHRQFRFDRELVKARMRHMILSGSSNATLWDLDSIEWTPMAFELERTWIDGVGCGWCGDSTCDMVLLALGVIWEFDHNHETSEVIRGSSRWWWLNNTTVPIQLEACQSSLDGDTLHVQCQSRLFCRKCQPTVDEFLMGARQEASHPITHQPTIAEIALVPQLIPDLAAIVGSYLFTPPDPDAPQPAVDLRLYYPWSYDDDTTTWPGHNATTQDSRVNEWTSTIQDVD